MLNLVRVEILALKQTQAGCAVFLGNDSKTIIFYIDPAIGLSIHAELTGNSLPRPLTHDLFTQTLMAFGASVSRIIITRQESDVFFAQLVIDAENEIMEKKIVELDARPSDCLALAVRSKAPIFIYQKLWDSLENHHDLIGNLGQSEDEPFEFLEDF